MRSGSRVQNGCEALERRVEVYYWQEETRAVPEKRVRLFQQTIVLRGS